VYRGRIFSFVYCVVITVFFVALYIARHNQLVEMRIRVIALERELKIEEAKVRRLELQMASFLSPVRLEEVARRAQFSHLKQPSLNDIEESS